jgi:signal transduction histidine kinase
VTRALRKVGLCAYVSPTGTLSNTGIDSETEITRLRERVAELEREKADVEGFAAMAAHELLTPVVIMDACAATVCERLDGNEGHAESVRELDTLRRGAARSRLLVETLLRQARVNGRPPQRRPVDIGALVGDCVALLGPDLRRRDAEVNAGWLPSVEAEEPLIGAVFMNLLVNALKYGPRLGATVRVGAAEEPGAWRFDVESQGEPIPAEDRERIFEPYRRGRGERRARGSGLGLYICRRIVERHGGEIGVSSPERGGNRFHFTLPK